jgi:hypothetical protein
MAFCDIYKLNYANSYVFLSLTLWHCFQMPLQRIGICLYKLIYCLTPNNYRVVECLFPKLTLDSQLWG